MPNRKAYINDLVVYIKKNLQKGYSKDSLKWTLIGQGYPRIEVEKAIKKVEEELRLPLMNIIFARCNLKAMELEEAVNLPFHIPTPKFTAKDKEKKEP